MKVQCRCGALIHDSTDDLSHKAHVISDKGWNALWDSIDDLIENRCASPAEREQACTILRVFVGNASRTGYQCSQCGSLYLYDAHSHLHCYSPADASSSRQIFFPGDAPNA
jgi:hypothetical protein